MKNFWEKGHELVLAKEVTEVKRMLTSFIKKLKADG
jgi:hypothetical protein